MNFCKAHVCTLANLWWWTDHFSMQAWILQAILIVLVIELLRVLYGFVVWRRRKNWVGLNSKPELVEVTLFGETFRVPLEVAEAYGLKPNKRR